MVTCLLSEVKICFVVIMIDHSTNSEHRFMPLVMSLVSVLFDAEFLLKPL